MTESCNPEFVFVKRGQDPSQWVGITRQKVYTDVPRKDGPPMKGDFTGHYFVQDLDGYYLPAHASQLQPAKKEDWDKALKESQKEKERWAKERDSMKFEAPPEVVYKGDGFTNAQSVR